MDQELADTPRNSIDNIKSHSCPPPLGYSLRDRKLSITICWCLILIDSCLLAVALFYPLWYGTSMSKTNVMTIVSCLAGVFSLFQFFWRGWILAKKDSLRPVGGTKWGFDMFQWIYVIAVIAVTLELVFGTISDDPNIPLCSMPVPTVVFIAAGSELLCTIGYFLNARVPISISSVRKGDHCRPGVYTIIEDVIAVDGSGGLGFRDALDRRYQASPEFRRMLAKLSLFWSVPALLVAGGCTAVIWTVPIGVAYGIGWCAPFVWAAIWAVMTVIWVPRMLRKERQAWMRVNGQV